MKNSDITLKKRHIAKSVSYRMVSTLIGSSLIAITTGSWEFGAIFSIVELIYKPIQYYIHERIWYRFIKYGLKK